MRHYRQGAGEISSTTEYPSLAASLAVFADDPLELEPGSDFQDTSEAGHPAVYRTGGGTGFVGLLLHYPEQNVTGALLVNQNQWQGRVEVLSAILEPYLAVAEAGTGR